jgi:hypothetical protein
MDERYCEIVFCDIKYYTLSEGTRAQITFQQYIALRNPSWSEDEVIHEIIVVGEKRARESRWREEQRDPMPSRC